MQKKISTLALLLVLLLFGSNTQALVETAQQGDGVAPIFKDLSDEAKNDVPRTKSVVQDWNLVCEQLCGAGLGGPLCDPLCKTVVKPLNQQQSGITPRTRFGKICRSLCKYRLGGSECPCQIFALKEQIDVDRLDRNVVCDAFCKENNITVAGCSPCFGKSVRATISDRHGAANSVVSGVNKRQPEAPKAAYPHASKHKPTPEDEAVKKSTPGTTSSTTPNWDEVCLSLCKIGEGGVLCNCDLPPFF